MEVQKFSPLRMCIEKTNKEDKKQLNKLKKLSASKQHYSKLKAAFFTSKLWPNNQELKISFLEKPSANIERTSLMKLKGNRKGEIDPLQYKVQNMDIISAIKLIVKERIEPITNLTFKFINDPKKAEIRILFDEMQGAWSLLGTDCLTEKDHTQPTMNLGWFDVPTVMHEFGHTLGLIHEHQNPSGNTIQWDAEKVYKWASKTQGWDNETTYTNIIEKYKSDQINGSDFDPDSIMLYFFPASLTLNNKGTDENLRLSKYDVLYINSVYPNSPQNVQQFYSKIYGVEITNTIPPFRKNKVVSKVKTGIDEKITEKSSNSDTANNIFIGILITLIILFFIFIIVKYVLPKSNKLKIQNFTPMKI